MTRLLFKFTLSFILSAHILNAETNDDRYVAKALNCLDKAIHLSLSISDEDERTCVNNSFNELKSDIQVALEQKDYKKISHSFVTKYENSDELLAECRDSDLRIEILMCLCSVMKELSALECSNP